MTKTRLIWMLLSCCIFLGQTKKTIIITNVRCHIKSTIVSRVNCYVENLNSLNIEVKTSNDIGINSLLGLSQLRLFTHGRTNVMRLNGIRLDICKLLANGQKKSLLNMLYTGIAQTDNNLPKKCPFKTNTTYTLHNMKFDATYLPSYLPEYNFTFTALFHANRVNSFEVRVNGSFCEINHDCTGLKVLDL